DDTVLDAVTGHAAFGLRRVEAGLGVGIVGLRLGGARLRVVRASLGRRRGSVVHRFLATHRTDHTVLLGKVAVCITCVLGQRRHQLDLFLAVTHAGDVLYIRDSPVANAALRCRGARPHAVVGGHAVAVWHALLHFADGL